MCSNRWVGLKLGAKPSRQYELYNRGKLSSNMDRDRLDLRKSVFECERFINDCYRKINSHTQEISDCNQKIDELPKRINRMLDFANESRIERKKMEQEAECLRSKADSFCLQGLLDREVNGFKSTNLRKADSFCLKGLMDREVNGLKSTKDLLRLANNNAWKQVYRKKDALRCEESAIEFEADATESENKVNEFRIKKGELQTKKDKLKRSLPKWEENVAKKKENETMKEEKMRAEMDYKLWRIFQK